MLNEEALMTEIKTHIDEVIETKLKPVVGAEAAASARKIVEEMRLERAQFGYDRTGLTEDQKKNFAQVAKAIAFGSTKANEALISEIDSRGGYLLPTEVAGAIERIARSVGVAMSQMTKWTMNSDKLDIPAYTGAALTGAYLGVNTAGPATALSFKSASLYAQKWQLAFVVGNDLLEDSPVSLTDWLLALAGESLANMVDYQIFIGTGNPFTGILTSGDVTTRELPSGENTFAEYRVVEDSALAIGDVEESTLDGAAFYMSRTVWASLRTQKDDAGNYLLGANAGANLMTSDPTSPAGPRPVGQIMGHPVYTCRHMPALTASAASTKFIVFGNMKYAAYGSRGDMRLEQFNSGSFGGNEIALTDQKGLVFKNRHAVAITLPEAFVAIYTNSV